MTTEAIAICPIETPIGDFVLGANTEGLTHCTLRGSPSLPADRLANGAEASAQRHLDAASEALTAYFNGEKDPWGELTLLPQGTDFQLRVWAALRRIPFGATLSYVGLARAVHSPRAARAVGQANHHNPLGVIIPCHRVVAADGSIGGYGGGLDRKRWLLQHEGVLPKELFETSSPGITAVR
jgi:methylated-DNA-[protein]-cysteine S-methyltransferase